MTLTTNEILEKIESTPTQSDVAYLYRLTSPSGRCYFGIAKNVRKRWQEHAADARNGKGYVLHAAIRKYGFENFKKEIMVAASFSYVKDLEVKAIAAYNSRVNGYNLTDGGDGTRNIVVSPERRRKTALSNLGKKRSEETRLKISNALKGRKLPESVKSKIGAASAAVPRNESWKANISKSKKGVPSTEEAKKIRSESQRLKWKDPEYRAKQLERQKLGLERYRQEKLNAV